MTRWTIVFLLFAIKSIFAFLAILLTFAFTDLISDKTFIATSAVLLTVVLIVLLVTLIIGNKETPKKKANTFRAQGDGIILPRDRYSEALVDAYNEIARARAKHGENDFHGAHHGYAILKEEVDEAWDEIKRDNHELARKEMNQVAAMAIRFVAEV